MRRLLIVAAALGVLWLLAWGGARCLIVQAELAQADAIAVLAGSATYVERTRLAAAFYKDGRAPRIILTNDDLESGWSESKERHPLFVERAGEELQRHGVPADKIEIIQPPVSSTFDEATALRDYATTHKFRSLMVVTSAYHTRRALWTLRRVFEGSDLEIGIDAPPPGWETPAPSTWWWHRRGWKLVAGEYVKMSYYCMRY